jgi:hypothetical protein
MALASLHALAGAIATEPALMMTLIIIACNDDGQHYYRQQ